MFRSCCNLVASSSREIVLYILVSSANNFTDDFSRAGKSFMYSKNSVASELTNLTCAKLFSTFELVAIISHYFR